MAEGDLLIEDGSVNKFNGNSSEANVVEEQEPNFDDPDDFIDDISDEGTFFTFCLFFILFIYLNY